LVFLISNLVSLKSVLLGVIDGI